MTSALFPHQAEGVRRLNAFKGGGYGLFYAPGGGKSRTAIEYLRRSRPKRTLIVCPAFVRKTWEREFGLWAPEGEFAITNVSKGKDFAKVAGGDCLSVVVTSYELLKHFKEPVDVIVLDEGHYLARDSSIRSKEARRIANLSGETFVLALTGTPAPQEPRDLWNLLDTMNPGMFGSYWSFVRRYCNEVPNPWTPMGKEFKGLRQDRAAELSRLLDRVSHRVTFDEFAAHVPKLRPSVIHIKGRRKAKLDWDDPAAFESLLELNSSAKIDAIVELTESSILGGLKKFCWGTWLKSTAEHLQGRIEALGIKTYVVNGDVASDDRQSVFDQWAKETKPAVLIVGIAAVKEGVNELVAAEVAGVVEIPWRANDMTQFTKRFERLNSKHSTLFYFFVVEGNKRDERAAAAFVRRQSDINAIIAAGHDDKTLVETLKLQEASDEDVLSALGAA